MTRKPYRLNVVGDFYVEEGCCLLCGVPEDIAPQLFASIYENEQCFVKRQPATREEVDDLLKVMAHQELNCVRYLALAELYAAALVLPTTSVLFDPADDDDVESPESEQPDPDRADNPELQRALAPLCEMLGQRAFYREIFDPFDASEVEVMGSLSDDLQDIYRDVRSGLLKWDRGEAGAALWEWRFNFEGHWGEHTTSALRALYALCAWYDGEWPSAPIRP
jgi:hypothetical protein